MSIIPAVLIAVLVTQPAAPPAAPNVSARLLAANQSVQPGGRTDLLLEIDVPQPWHIYHPVLLDTGLPTSVKFTAPPGVSIGELRFPVPTLGTTAGLEYLELAGKVACIAPLTVAADVKPGQTLAIRADVDALACVELCLPVHTSASLDLPVTETQGPPANPERFKAAREALAPRLSEAPYLAGSSAGVAKDKLGIDEPAELVVTIRVQRGNHIWDRQPGIEGLIPSRLFIEKVPGLELAEEAKQVWPEPKVVDMPGIGKVREHTGSFEIRVPFRIIDRLFPSGPVTVRVLLSYQSCTDSGTCFPPEMAEGVVHFEAATPNAPRAAPAAAAGGEADAGRGGDGKSGHGQAGETNLLVVLLLAFLGGLVLNVMPCVLPVISLKIISFVQQSGEDPKRVLRLGLAFCTGIMIWFWLFGALSAGGNLPLQYPSVVIAIGTILFVLALNMFGVFEIALPGKAAGRLDAVARREGYGGAFFKGFLATLLGTACTAPFLAGALVYAAAQPALVAFLVFTAAGLGMASPYLLLSAKPAWMRYIPRPRPSVVTFKQGMSFILLGTVVWLLWILGNQLGANGVVWTVAFWGFLALALWLLGKSSPAWSLGRRGVIWVCAALVGVFGYWFSFHVMYEPQPAVSIAATPDSVLQHVARSDWQRIPWAPYRKGIAEELSRRGYTVYVDYTASWCATCLANEAAALERDSVRLLMRQMGVIPIKADFTSRDPEMWAEIKSFGRPTVPLNLIYPAKRPEDVITLPVILTPGIVSSSLAEAGPSFSAPQLVENVQGQAALTPTVGTAEGTPAAPR